MTIFTFSINLDIFQAKKSRSETLGNSGLSSLNYFTLFYFYFVCKFYVSKCCWSVHYSEEMQNASWWTCEKSFKINNNLIYIFMFWYLLFYVYPLPHCGLLGKLEYVSHRGTLAQPNYQKVKSNPIISRSIFGSKVQWREIYG